MHSRFYTYWTTANISDCIMLYIFLCSSFKCLAGFPFYILYFCMYDQTFAAQFCEDDDLGGGLCHLWSSDHALLVMEIITIIIEIIIMRVTRMMWKRSLSSCSFRPQAKLRKMTQLQRKKNPIKTKHEENEAAWPWTFFSLNITYLCLDTLQNQMTWNNFWVSSIFPLHVPVASLMIVWRKLVDSILFLFFYFGWAKSGFDVTWQYCTLEYFDQSFTLKDVFLAVQDSSIVMVTWTGQIRNSCDVCVSKGELFLRWSEWLLRKLDKQIFSRVQISCAWSTLVQYKTCLLNGPPHFQSQGF